MSRLRTAKYQHSQVDERRSIAADGEQHCPRPATKSPTGRTWPMSASSGRSCAGVVFKAILALPAIYRAPVMLRDIQGMSTEEASATAPGQGSDAQVAAAPWPVDSSASSSRTSPVAWPCHQCAEPLLDADAGPFQAQRACIALSRATRSWALRAGVSTRHDSSGAHPAPAARPSATAVQHESSGATKQHMIPAATRRGCRRRLSRRSRQGIRAGRPERRDSAARRRRAGSSAPVRATAGDGHVLPRHHRL